MLSTAHATSKIVQVSVSEIVDFENKLKTSFKIICAMIAKEKNSAKKFQFM